MYVIKLRIFLALAVWQLDKVCGPRRKNCNSSDYSPRFARAANFTLVAIFSPGTTNFISLQYIRLGAQNIPFVITYIRWGPCNVHVLLLYVRVYWCECNGDTYQGMNIT